MHTWSGKTPDGHLKLRMVTDLTPDAVKLWAAAIEGAESPAVAVTHDDQLTAGPAIIADGTASARCPRRTVTCSVGQSTASRQKSGAAPVERGVRVRV